MRIARVPRRDGRAPGTSQAGIWHHPPPHGEPRRRRQYRLQGTGRRIDPVACLPVAVPGALTSIGDGHAARGDGEVAGTAIRARYDDRGFSSSWSAGVAGSRRVHAGESGWPDHLRASARITNAAMGDALDAMLQPPGCRPKLQGLRQGTAAHGVGCQPGARPGESRRWRNQSPGRSCMRCFRGRVDQLWPQEGSFGAPELPTRVDRLAAPNLVPQISGLRCACARVWGEACSLGQGLWESKRGSTLLSKRVMAQIRPPEGERVSRSRQRIPPGTRR